MKSLQDALCVCIWRTNFHKRQLDCLMKIVSLDGIRNRNALERASSAPLVDGLPYTEWNVPMTSDCKMIQVCIYIDSNY
jgi:hypothetical protein